MKTDEEISTMLSEISECMSTAVGYIYVRDIAILLKENDEFLLMVRRFHKLCEMANKDPSVMRANQPSPVERSDYE